MSRYSLVMACSQPNASNIFKVEIHLGMFYFCQNSEFLKYPMSHSSLCKVMRKRRAFNECFKMKHIKPPDQNDEEFEQLAFSSFSLLAYLSFLHIVSLTVLLFRTILQRCAT